MVFAAPEFVIAERVELLDEIEVAAELQHRMLAKGVMRGEEGSEFQARHIGFLPSGIFLFSRAAGYVLAGSNAIGARPVDPHGGQPCVQPMDRRGAACGFSATPRRLLR